MKKWDWKRRMATVLTICICLTAIPFTGTAAVVQDLSFMANMGLTVEQDTYVVGIPEKCEAIDVLYRLQNTDLAIVVNANGKQCANSGIVATGYALQTADGKKTLTLVVKGDVTGSGDVKSADYLTIKQYMQGAVPLTGAKLRAADVTDDGKITSTDYLQIKKYFNGTFELYEALPVAPAPGEVALLAPDDDTKDVQIANDKVRAVMTMDSFDPKVLKGTSNAYTPKTLRLSWVGRTGSYMAYLATKSDFSDAVTYQTERSYWRLTNLLRNTTYYWKVVSTDGSEQSPVFTFTTADETRTVQIDGVSNSRDIGGYVNADGTKRIKQGIIYRTAALVHITDTGVTTFCDQLGIKTEIDLTGGGASSDKLIGVVRKDCSIKWYQEVITDTNPDYRAALKEAVLVFADASNFPVDYHCAAGRDRTGTLTYILLGLCDCNLVDMQRDYAMTWLSTYGNPGGDSPLSSYMGLFAKMHAAFSSYKDSSLPLSENISAFLLDLGLTQAEIDAIVNNISEPV